MHDNGFFADILQLIWLIINTDMYVYFILTVNYRDQVSSVVEFTNSIIICTHRMV